MIIITGYDGFIAKNLIVNLNQNKIIKIKRNLKKLNKVKNRTIKIVNFASLYQKKSLFKDLNKLLDANFIYPIRVIQKLIENNNKIIFFNICSYFQIEQNFKNKSNLYSSVKNSFKEIIKFYTKDENFKSFDIYLYDVFGYGDNRPKLFNMIVDSYRKKKILKIDNPSAEMVPVHISELIKILKKFINDRKRPKKIHINHGKKITVNKIIDIAQKIYPNLKIKMKKNQTKPNNLFYIKPRKYDYKKNLNSFIKYFFKQYV